MDAINPRKILSIFVSFAFIGSLFLFLTPFQDDISNSMWPKYLAVGTSIFFLAPIIFIKKITISSPSLFIIMAMLAIICHTIFIRPLSFHFNLLIVANFTMAILIYELSQKWQPEFESAVYSLLIANITAIIVQALMFFLYDGKIYDFHKFIFGSDSRFSEDYLGIARFAGMQVEPGTYANNVAYLLAILIITSNFSKKNYWISIFSVVSILLTNSASAIYFASILLVLLLLFWGNRIKISHVIILALAIILYLYSSNIFEHLNSRFSQGNDGSLSFRLIGLKSYWATGLEDKVLGLGFDYQPCFECHYQDIGVIFNLVSSGGILLCLVLSTLLYRSLKLNGILLCVFILALQLNSKMYFYGAPVWLIFLFSLTNLKHRKIMPFRRLSTTPMNAPY